MLRLCPRCHVAKEKFHANRICADCENERHRLDYAASKMNQGEPELYAERSAFRRLVEYERACALKPEVKVEVDDDPFDRTPLLPRRWRAW